MSDPVLDTDAIASHAAPPLSFAGEEPTRYFADGVGHVRSQRWWRPGAVKPSTHGEGDGCGVGEEGAVGGLVLEAVGAGVAGGGGVGEGAVARATSWP